MYISQSPRNPQVICPATWSLFPVGHWPFYDRTYSLKVGSELPEPQLKYLEKISIGTGLRNRTPNLLFGSRVYYHLSHRCSSNFNWPEKLCPTIISIKKKNNYHDISISPILNRWEKIHGMIGNTITYNFKSSIRNFINLKIEFFINFNKITLLIKHFLTKYY